MGEKRPLSPEPAALTGATGSEEQPAKRLRVEEPSTSEEKLQNAVDAAAELSLKSASEEKEDEKIVSDEKEPEEDDEAEEEEGTETFYVSRSFQIMWF